MNDVYVIVATVHYRQVNGFWLLFSSTNWKGKGLLFGLAARSTAVDVGSSEAINVVEGRAAGLSSYANGRILLSRFPFIFLLVFFLRSTLIPSSLGRLSNRLIVVPSVWQESSTSDDVTRKGRSLTFAGCHSIH